MWFVELGTVKRAKRGGPPGLLRRNYESEGAAANGSLDPTGIRARPPERSVGNSRQSRAQAKWWRKNDPRATTLLCSTGWPVNIFLDSGRGTVPHVEEVCPRLTTTTSSRCSSKISSRLIPSRRRPSSVPVYGCTALISSKASRGTPPLIFKGRVRLGCERCLKNRSLGRREQIGK